MSYAAEVCSHFHNFGLLISMKVKGGPAKTIIRANTLRSPTERQANNVVRKISSLVAVLALKEGPKQ